METRDIIEELLLQNNMSQCQLASLLQVSQKTIGNWVNGADLPNANNILTFYRVFGITPNEMLGLEEPKNFKPKAGDNSPEA